MALREEAVSAFLFKVQKDGRSNEFSWWDLNIGDMCLVSIYIYIYREGERVCGVYIYIFIQMYRVRTHTHIYIYIYNMANIFQV